MVEELQRVDFSAFGESITAYLNRIVYLPDTSEMEVISNFRIASLVAIAKEDDAHNRRNGGQGYIFHHLIIAATPLPIARAGAAVYYNALKEYCETKGLDPKELLIKNGTEDRAAEMYLEYGHYVKDKIETVISARQD